MKISHFGIAVHSIEESLKFYQAALGLVVHREEVVRDQGVRVAMLPIGESRVELLEAVNEDSPVARFIAKRGEGLHHVCIEVENIEETLDRLKASGVRLIDETPRRGAGGHRIAFVHPSSANGVLIEIAEQPADRDRADGLATTDD